MSRIEITGLNLSGEGVAEGLAEPRPLSLPGDVYSTENNALLEPSPHRQIPPCPHFGTCGGCALQHASDDFVADWKTEITRKALAAHGLKTELRPSPSSHPREPRAVAPFLQLAALRKPCKSAFTNAAATHSSRSANARF